MDYFGLNDHSIELQEVLEVRDFFNEIDANGDGVLSLAEMLSVDYTLTFSDALDLNADGFISLEELLTLSVGAVGQVTPVYVDFERMEVGRGTLTEPFNLFNEAQVFVKSGGMVRVLGGNSPETFIGARRLAKPISIQSEHGLPVSIGETP